MIARFGFSDLMIHQAARRAGADVMKTFEKKTRLERVTLDSQIA
jgi:hypothetical protein